MTRQLYQEKEDEKWINNPQWNIPYTEIRFLIKIGKENPSITRPDFCLEYNIAKNGKTDWHVDSNAWKWWLWYLDYFGHTSIADSIIASNGGPATQRRLPKRYQL
jgi:hypothetical protein